MKNVTKSNWGLGVHLVSPKYRKPWPTVEKWYAKKSDTGTFLKVDYEN